MNFIGSLDKLRGRENYPTWKFAVKSYLEHEELWDAVLGKEDDAKKVTKARTKIIMLLEPSIFVHVQECKSAKDVWDTLSKNLKTLV